MATASIEIPKGSGNKVSVNVDTYNALSQDERKSFYVQQSKLYNQRQMDLQQQNIDADARKLQERQSSTTGEKISGTARGVGQGLTLGFGDEIEAGVRTGFGLLGNYDDKVSDIRGQISDFRESDPALAIGSEIGGAILPALASGVFTGGAGTGAVLGATGARLGANQGLKQIAKRMPNVIQGAKTGGLYGGAYGMGTAESEAGANAFQVAKDRLSGLGQGATIGAVTGGVLQPVITKGMAGGRALMNSLSRSDDAIERKANEQILNTATKDVGTSRTGFQTPENVPSMLNIGQRMDSRAVNNNVGGLGKSLPDYKVNTPTVIADAGENLQGLGYATQQIANPSRRGVTETLVSRNEEQGARILDAVKNTTGISDDKLGITYMAKLDDQIREMSEPAYKEAYKTSIPAKEFKSFFTNEERKKAILEAGKLALKRLRMDDKKVPPNLAKMFDETSPTYFGSFDDIMNQNFDTEFLHAIKKGFDGLVRKNTKTVDRFTNKLTDDGIAYDSLRRAFNETIKKNNPAYANANKQFASQKKLEEAFRLGEKYKTTTIDRIRKQFDDFTPAEQEAWKSGMVTKLEDLASTQGKNRDFLANIDSSKKLDEIFDLLLGGNSNQRKAFDSLIKSEKSMRETFNRMRLNSDTNTKQEAMKTFRDGGGSIVNSENTFQFARNLAREGIKKAQKTYSGGTNEKRAELIAEKLFTTDRATQQQVLKQLLKTNERLGKEVTKRLRNANRLTAGATGQINSNN